MKNKITAPFKFCRLNKPEPFQVLAIAISGLARKNSRNNQLYFDIHHKDCKPKFLIGITIADKTGEHILGVFAIYTDLSLWWPVYVNAWDTFEEINEFDVPLGGTVRKILTTENMILRKFRAKTTQDIFDAVQQYIVSGKQLFIPKQPNIASA